MLRAANTKALAVITALLVALVAFFVIKDSGSIKTINAQFPRAVSVYEGSEVRVMGVKIGMVTSVVPAGDHVRVAMEYDSDYKIPAKAKAAVVTPTLVADRFIQIEPAYTGGAEMPNGGTIGLDKTATPVELDRIYKSLDDLTQALGPNGANKNGALSDLLDAGDAALAGNGELGNQTIVNFSKAVQAFGDNSGPLFASVRSLASVTETLAVNDAFVQDFVADLTSVSTQLDGESDELRKALASLARAIGMVKGFVKDNKASLTKSVKGLNEVLATIEKEKDDLDVSLRLAPLGIGNLANAFDPYSGSIGSRVQFGPTFQNFSVVLCNAVIVELGEKEAKPACDLLAAFFSFDNGGVGTNVGAGYREPEEKYGKTRPVQDMSGLLDTLGKEAA